MSSGRVTPTTTELEQLQEFNASARASINRLRAKAVVALRELGDEEGANDAQRLAKLALNQLGLIDEYLEGWHLVAEAMERRSEWRLGIESLDQRIQELELLKLRRLALEEGQLTNAKTSTFPKKVDAGGGRIPSR